MPSYKRPYLDTSVYLALIKGEENRAALARQIFDDADRGTFRIVASTFVAAEIIRGRGETSYLDEENERTIQQFLQRSCIEWVELDLLLAMEARRLARLHSLKPGDAVHLASAIRGGADFLLRWDGRFHPGTYEGIEVRDPFWDGQPELPLEHEP